MTQTDTTQQALNDLTRLTLDVLGAILTEPQLDMKPDCLRGLSIRQWYGVLRTAQPSAGSAPVALRDMLAAFGPKAKTAAEQTACTAGYAALASQPSAGSAPADRDALCKAWKRDFINAGYLYGEEETANAHGWYAKGFAAAGSAPESS